MQFSVRDNNADQALGALKNKQKRSAVPARKRSAKG